MTLLVAFGLGLLCAFGLLGGLIAIGAPKLAEQLDDANREGER